MKRILEYSIPCLISIAAYFFWAIPFRGVLNYHEEFQLFLNDADYFTAHLMQQGGLSVYISEFLIQFYNNYWIGALILALEFVLIQRLSLLILKNINATWAQKHTYIIYLLSTVPTLIVWVVVGDIQVKHSLIIAVILALSLIFFLTCVLKSRIYRCVGAIIAIGFYYWAAGISHYRIPGATIAWENIYNSKTMELLDYDLQVRTSKWEQIIKQAKAKQPDLPMSVCATNLALGMTGQMGQRAVEFYQHGAEGLFPPFSKDPFLTLTTAEVYFYLGMINTAQRYYFEAMEAAADYTKSCRCLRRLAETNLINGQYGVASKYLHLLEKTTFYKKWAQRNLELIARGEMAVLEHPLYGRLRMMRLKDDFLYSDREIDKICGRLVMQNYDNVLAMQYMLLYPLLVKNYDLFVQYMSLLKEEVPYTPELASFEKYLRKP